jgi:nucleotide-binding universal stress UspA family protein
VTAVVEIRHILCPTDLSDIAPRAFDHALALARFHQAEIELAYVSEPLLPGPIVPTSCPPWAVLDPAVRGRLRSALEALAAPANALDIPVRIEVYEGRVVAEILGRAGTWPADVVTMGTHGRSGFERWALGSVTEKVLRKASCPVLTVPPPAEGLHPSGAVLFRRIVCPVDFSEASLAALGHALELAEESCAEITVLHVLECLVEDEPGARVAGFDVPEFRRCLEKDARERLHKVVPEDARDWYRPREEVVGGRPGREILRVAEERQADLVVMGVRGRNPVNLALFGSTTHHVVRGARCPVLVVHEDSR